ncbi:MULTISPECIES: hypothetical protein [Cellulosimicrobium]|uniref:Uncharacterized protein n=1 Tax=Cellulosimicrobium funkei TaxID=264251 RepID=A0A4Y8R8U2_9MICO|nr:MULTISPECIES: hypothetical protein [Cellulosimicrobium]MBE9937791.1 hypothetical protein [Cellulosimicrobium cellulans]TFF17286.1 hypothetical protein E1O70_00330 [Cellulosimicrobium funkei]TGA74187.1 hypothetical protein EQW79_009195 [Cellulosimicrobium terreum]
MRVQKKDVVIEIADALGREAPKMSTGSTEPRTIFDMVNKELALGLSTELTKPQIAQAIVESTGEVWAPDFESRGGTVTLKGLQAVRDAVRFYVD